MSTIKQLQQYTTEDGRPTGVRTDSPLSRDLSALLAEQRSHADSLMDELVQLADRIGHPGMLEAFLGDRELAADVLASLVRAVAIVGYLRSDAETTEGIRAKVIDQTEGAEA